MTGYKVSIPYHFNKQVNVKFRKSHTLATVILKIDSHIAPTGNK